MLSSSTMQQVWILPFYTKLFQKLSWICVCGVGCVQGADCSGNGEWLWKGKGRGLPSARVYSPPFGAPAGPRRASSRWECVGGVGEVISLWQGCASTPAPCPGEVKVVRDVPCHSSVSLPCRHQHGRGAQTQQTQRAEESSLCLVQVGVNTMGEVSGLVFALQHPPATALSSLLPAPSSLGTAAHPELPPRAPSLGSGSPRVGQCLWWCGRCPGHCPTCAGVAPGEGWGRVGSSCFDHGTGGVARGAPPSSQGAGGRKTGNRDNSEKEKGRREGREEGKKVGSPWGDKWR